MKKQYYIPQTEVMKVNTVLMAITGEASVLAGPGEVSGAPQKPKAPAF